MVMKVKKIKVIHLPTTVGGNPQCISRHMNEIGLDSEAWAIKQNYLGYPADKFISKSTDGIFITEIKKLFALRYIFMFDIAFFNFGTGLYTPYPNINFKNCNVVVRIIFPLYYAYSTLMAKLEIMLLGILKRVVLIQYQGDDVRQGDFSLNNFDISIASRVDSGYYNTISDARKRKRVHLYSKIARKIYALNPDLLYMLPPSAKFLPYSHISIDEWNPSYTQMDERPLRIGHAPTNRDVKGTEFIIEAVERLQALGYKLELILVEGMAHSHAKKIYNTIDVLVDQLFAGWYGGLAVEAMALGKPVVCYIREKDLIFIPDEMRDDLPIINACSYNLYDVLLGLVTKPRVELLELAKASRKYVEKWHNPNLIVKDIADNFLYDANH